MGLFSKLFGGNNTANLQSLINDGALLADVRTPVEFSEGHVTGSVNIPLDKVAVQLTKFKDKKHIIVFCRSGGRSSQAKLILEQNGFANVTNGGSWTNVRQFVK
ncbi:MAG: rhodanese-like domain-containing protein [Bacteroidota bacterium]